MLYTITIGIQMKIKEIYEILDNIAPFNSQENWDNSGILIGNLESEFNKIYASLDIDLNLINNLDPNSLLITHHPLIFKSFKKLDLSTYPSKILAELIKKNISLISMHTNYDKYILNEYVAKNIIGYKIKEIKDFIVFFDTNFTFEKLVLDIKKKFELKNLRAVKAKNNIKTVALCTGSGADLIQGLKADCFITGDLKYHTALECLENNLSLIDIGHFESERYFGSSLAEVLQKNKIKVIIQNSINPFTYY